MIDTRLLDMAVKDVYRRAFMDCHSAIRSDPFTQVSKTFVVHLVRAEYARLLDEEQRKAKKRLI